MREASLPRVLCDLYWWQLCLGQGVDEAGKGRGPEQVCPGPACSTWVDFVKEKDSTTRIQVILRGHLLKLGTGKQEGPRSSSRRETR